MKRPRVAVFGHCQSIPLVRTLRFLAPDLQVARFPIESLTRYPTKEDVFRELDSYDLVYAHPFGLEFHPSVAGWTLQERLTGRFRFYPLIEFNAFHPDCVYVMRREPAGLAESAIGRRAYHSALAFLGYSLGLSVERTLSLFNADVFERLGYFRFWKISEDSLLAHCRSIGFPVQPLYRSWVRRCPFMHSVNRPRLFAIAGIAGVLLRDAGFGNRSEAMISVVENYLYDELLFSPVWPIYPEVAAAMSIDGAYIFKCSTKPSDERDGLFLTLPEFVEKSFELYSQDEPGNLQCDRVEEWKRDEGLFEYLRSR